MKKIFDSHRNKTHFQNLNKDFAHSLVLKVKIGTRKWPTPKPHVEACVAERLTPRTLDLEVQGSSLARRVLSLDKELTPLCLSLPGCINGCQRHTAGG